jgi:hypothetical protein
MPCSPYWSGIGAESIGVIPKNVALIRSSETAYDTCRKSEESRSNAEIMECLRDGLAA